MVDHVVQLLLFINHHVGIVLKAHLMRIINFIALFHKSSRVFRLGTDSKLAECGLHEVIFVEHVNLLALEGSCEVIKASYILIFQLLLLRKIGPF